MAASAAGRIDSMVMLMATGMAEASAWNHKSVLQPILRDGHGAFHRARIRATRWRPPQDEV
jgi:hypothetical protein